MPFENIRNDIANFKLSEKLFQSIASYIDENYVDDYSLDAWSLCNFKEEMPPRGEHLFQDRDYCKISDTLGEDVPHASMDTANAIDLEAFLKQMDAGFTETLLKLIDKTGKKDSEIYKKANISKQHFSKIRSNINYKPTKPTAIALALALELGLDETCDLIGRAGYTLTNSSKFDLIIRYFIERGNYNVVEINIALYEFDQTLLGG